MIVLKVSPNVVDIKSMLSICCVYRLPGIYIFPLVMSSYLLFCCTLYEVSILMFGVSHVI